MRPQFVVPIISAFLGCYLYVLLTRDQTCSLGISGRCFNPLSDLAKVLMRTFIRSTDDVARCRLSIYQR